MDPLPGFWVSFPDEPKLGGKGVSGPAVLTIIGSSVLPVGNDSDSSVETLLAWPLELPVPQ